MKNLIKPIIVSLLSFCVVIVSAQAAQPKLGYALSPAGFPSDFSQMGPFLTEVADMCDGGSVLINGEWRNNVASSGNIPSLHNTLCQLQPSPFNYTEVPVFAWATYPTLHLDHPLNATNNWSNTNTRTAFLQMLIRTADSLAPTYIFIGNEVSFYWEQDSVDYTNWSSFYSMAYDSIKAHSPLTKVGTVFNYEHLSGKGAFVNWNMPYWNAFTAMDTSKMDVIGITLYPFLGKANATDVPNTYLDDLFGHIGNIPVVFTETGWTADSVAGAMWNSSPTQQVDYINALFPMITGKDVEIVSWLFLNYCMSNQNDYFESVAMRDSLGNDQPALPVWLSHCPSVSTGIGSFSEKNSNPVSIYPNPSSGIVNFTFDQHEPVQKLSVYDELGRIVFEKELNQNDQNVQLDLNKGIYFYRFHTKNKTYSSKIIIN